MTPINKNAVRAAVLIHEQLAGSTCHDLPIYLPEYGWNNVQQLQRQIDRARRRGWRRAVARLTEDMVSVLDDCRRHLENAHRALQSSTTERHVSSSADIYRDILALDDEFEEVEINLAEHTLSVTTDRIVLEYMTFGRFEIKLDWQRLGSPLAYRVVALDPNPAARSDAITHPHVQDEQLCEGEGRAAIQAVLAAGRLHDFFVVVSQLLHTYGRGSAYVELDNWDGTPCEECGACVDDDDRYYCQRCEINLCSGCAVSCAACGEHYCSGCLDKCAACGEAHCSSCLTMCDACGKQFCHDCLEEGLCVSCHEQQASEEPEDGSSANDAIGQPAGHSPGSRQRRPACVPA